MSIRNRLKDEISYHGLALKELANKAGISKRRLEPCVDSQEIMLATDETIRIATVLNVSVDYLATVKNNGNSDEVAKYKPLRKIIEDFRILPENERSSLR